MPLASSSAAFTLCSETSSSLQSQMVSWNQTNTLHQVIFNKLKKIISVLPLLQFLHQVVFGLHQAVSNVFGFGMLLGTDAQSSRALQLSVQGLHQLPQVTGTSVCIRAENKKQNNQGFSCIPATLSASCLEIDLQWSSCSLGASSFAALLSRFRLFT